ncbi:MAG: hypothetical protein ONB46_18400 [candidate division KSB1 bacterium]|nr:hypothetical protein [candidate division KSB1 bacterium]MDZ7367851.1 hypothetical protein [candidate division KSB1 bacterium]MDZ7405527.1 hypothetical protein [candidate division KSB1 bacterium]
MWNHFVGFVMLAGRFEMAFNIFNHRRDGLISRFTSINQVWIATDGVEASFFAVFPYEAAKSLHD